MTTKRKTASKRRLNVAGRSESREISGGSATAVARADAENGAVEPTAAPARAPSPSPYPRHDSREHTEANPAEDGPGDAEAAESNDAEPKAAAEVDDATQPRRSRVGAVLSKCAPRRDGTLVVIVLASVLAGTPVSLWFQQEASALRNVPAARNHALVAAEESDRVSERVSSSLEKLWSYDHAKLPASVDGAEAIAVQPFVDEYRKMKAEILETAPKQQASVAAQATQVAVKKLEDRHAVLIAFLNQRATKESSSEQQRAAARLRVEATKVDGKWMIARVRSV